MYIRSFALLFFGLAAAFSVAAQTTITTTTPSRTLSFPLVGLGSTQTARINVLNSAANSSSGTAASCTGSISFLTPGGTTIGTATSFTLTSGQLATASLPFASSGGSGNHTVIGGEVQLTAPATTPRPPCALQVSFELDDTTSGATQVLINGAMAPIGHF